MKKLTLALAFLSLAAVFALPVEAKDTSGPVTCKDGSTAPHGGRGACSKHGGINKDAAAPAAPAAPAAAAAAPAKPAAPAAPAAAPAKPEKAEKAAKTGEKSVNGDATGATAKCKDGSFSHSKTHTGTCSRHGGVAEWLDGSAAK
jgi:hypothetical protein